jgi:ligand-binding sensor domain-containing protein
VVLISTRIVNLSAQIFEWSSLTSVGTIKDIEATNGLILGGSNGGVLQLERISGNITKITNTEGLSSNEVVSVEVDQHGSIWFAHFDGTLNRFQPELDEWEVFEDYKDQVISDMLTFGDSLYVALDIGVSLFTIDKLEVKETYVNLGLSSGDNLEKIAAKAVFIGGTEIWVSTDKGIAQSSLTLPNLQAPASWSQYTVSQGLPTNTINEVVVLNAIPYAATPAGVFKFADGVWQLSGLGALEVFGFELVESNQQFSQATTLCYTSGGVFWLTPQGSWDRLGSNLNDVTALEVDEDGGLWIGQADQGLASFSFDTSEWQLAEVNGPASNNFKSVALDSKGRLWCASQSAGIHMFDGEAWTNISRADGLASNDQRTVIVDGQDRVWFGSWGGGITIIEESGDGFTFTKVDTSDGILSGAVTEDFVVINHLKQDQFDNLWALNREANNALVLVAHTPDDNWVHFSSSEGLFTSFVNVLEIDNAARVWVGTETGVKVLNYEGTLEDKSDDDFTQGLNAAEGLFSNNVLALAEDRDGIMWIGTDEGVNFWFGGRVGSQFGVINNFINVIGVDGRNNKWFGTSNGVSILSDDGVTWTHFTTGNSPLVSSNVLSFAFNESTGEAWIGTTNGLSRLQTPFSAPKPNLTLLTGYPNPFIVDGSVDCGRLGRDGGFKITNLAESTSVAIYNGSGSEIRKFEAGDIQGAEVCWDGKDADNAVVASGVYVYLAYTNGGISASGKVAVIRQ